MTKPANVLGWRLARFPYFAEGRFGDADVFDRYGVFRLQYPIDRIRPLAKSRFDVVTDILHGFNLQRQDNRKMQLRSTKKVLYMMTVLRYTSRHPQPNQDVP